MSCNGCLIFTHCLAVENAVENERAGTENAREPETLLSVFSVWQASGAKTERKWPQLSARHMELI